MRLARTNYTYGMLLAGLVVLLLSLFPFSSHAATTSGVAACDKIPTDPSCLSFSPVTNPLLKINNASPFCTPQNQAGTNGLCTSSDASAGSCQEYRLGDGLFGGSGSFASLCVKDGAYSWKVNNVVAGASDPLAAQGPIVTNDKELNGEVQTTVETPATQAAKALLPGDCNLTESGLGACIASIMGYIVAAIESVILFIVAGILGLANYLLGWTIYITVFQFGNLMGNSEGLLAAWRIVRDVGNILLLFGFIFMGISTILNLPHSEFTAKRALPTLIIFALLMNFSLLVTEGVIDVSNAFATSIHDQITGGEICEAGESQLGCALNEGIGGRLMQMSGVAGVFDVSENWNAANGGNGVTKAIIYAGLIIFVVITTLVLVAAAVMLIIRALVLAFLMVTSPIGFAGMAIPPLQEVAKKWWDELICQATFAPVYFLLVLVSFKLMEGVMKALGTGGNQSTENLASIFGTALDGGKVSNITIGITFALMIGFMIASLMFAKKSSCIGSGVAIKAGGSFAFGGLAFAGRHTAGRASLLAANRIRTSRFGQTGIGRMAFNVANKGASSSFDYRQGGWGRETLTKGVGDLGKVRKSVQHGMHGIEKDAKERKVKYAKEIGQTHAEAHREDELKKNRIAEEAARAATEKQRKEGPGGENDLRQKADEMASDNSTNRAKRASEMAAVQAEMNQAVADGRTEDAARFKNQLDVLMNNNETLTKEENAQLKERRDALKSHQDLTKQALQEYDKKIQRINAEISGGEFTEDDGSVTKFAGLTTDSKRKRYGESIQTSVLAKTIGATPLAELLPGGIAGHTDYEAGREVVKNAGKTKIERALDDIKNETSRGDGDTSHAPPAVPTSADGHTIH